MDNGAVSDPTGLIQFGVLGVIVFLMIFGYLWAKPAVDQLKKDKEKAEEDRDELIDIYQNQVIPVLSKMTEVAIPAIIQTQEDIAEIKRRLPQTSTTAPSARDNQ